MEVILYREVYTPMTIQSKNFNLKHIADSGQCFRMNPVSENTYSVIAYNHYLELIQKEPDIIEMTCDEEEYESIWKEYFDINYNYENIVNDLQKGEDEFLKSCGIWVWTKNFKTGSL